MFTALFSASLKIRSRYFSTGYLSCFFVEVVLFTLAFAVYLVHDLALSLGLLFSSNQCNPATSLQATLSPGLLLINAFAPSLAAHFLNFARRSNSFPKIFTISSNKKNCSVMSARLEIERHQHSLDSRRPQYQKRSTSLSALRSNYVAADIEMEDLPPQLLDIPRVPSARRQKSVSVCIATLPSSSLPPRTIEQYEQQVVRNGLPQNLSAYELQQVRMPALSTSEVFNEPPTMYVYKPRNVPTYPYLRPKKKLSTFHYVKKHKHTIAAVTFGVVALTAVMIIIIFQMKGDFA